jgi:UDP-2-acetamido-3-amino-2,3-dideoxy-glucuronate N-acetyltransferase
VETDAVGKRTRVWAFAHVQAGAVIGEACNIEGHCFVESRVITGDGVVVKSGVLEEGT